MLACLGKHAADLIQIAILLAIGWQGYLLYRQTMLTERTTEFGIMQGLRQETARIEGSVYTATPAFREAQLDNCASFTTATMQEELTVRHIIGHYELYYDAAKFPIISPAEWNGICEGGHRFIAGNCVIDRVWKQLVPKITTPAFQRAFATCALTR